MGFPHLISAPKLTLLVAALLLGALAIESGFLLLLPPSFRVNESADYWMHYEPTAENILNGRGITTASGNLELVYPPGYPIYLTAAFRLASLLGLNRNCMVEVFDVLTAAASSALLFLIVRLSFGDGIGLLAWVLWITYLPNLWTLKEPMSEVPFMLFLYGAVLVFSGGLYRRLTLTGLPVGVLLGAAALVRPIGLFLPLVFGFAALACQSIPVRKRATIALLVVTGFAASIAPWELHILRKTNKVIMLCTNGPSGIAEGLAFGVTGDPGEEQIWLPDHLRELMERANSWRQGKITARDIIQFAGQEAVRNPVGFCQLLLLKLCRPWYATGSRRHETPVLLLQFGYLAFAFAGLTNSLMACRCRKFWIMFLCCLVIYFWGMAFLVVPLVRYMVPAMAFLMPFAAIGMERFFASLA